MAARAPDYTRDNSSSYKLNIDSCLGQLYGDDAVVATLPAITIVDWCWHRAIDDTDRGEWRRKKGQSWRSEARSSGFYWGSYASVSAAVTAGAVIGDCYYNTSNARFEEVTATGIPASVATYRAGKEDYPANALITVESGRLIIWDCDGLQPAMWMVFVAASSAAWETTAPMIQVTTINSAGALNASIAVGTGSGVYIVSLLDDTGYSLRVAASRGYGMFHGNISQRNSGLGYTALDSAQQLAGESITSLDMMVDADAPVDPHGMPIPSMAFATTAGVSEMRGDGVVVNSASTSAAYGISYDELGRIRWNTTTEYNCSPVAPRSTSFTASSATEPKLSAAAYSSSNIPVSPAIASGAGKSVPGAVASTNGLTLYRAGMSSNALHAAITATYNTGWMVGDVRRCFLANGKTVDRSVKGATLAEVGTVTETAYTGGRSVYSGFSASNYFQEANHADWNALGTGDFSIVLSGIKFGTAGSARAIITFESAPVASGDLSLYLNPGNVLAFYAHNGTSFAQRFASTLTFTDSVEHVLELKRIAGTVFIVVDGVVVASGAYSSSVSTSAALRIGVDPAGLYPWVGGQCACVRIAATATTVEQSRFLATQENALNGGAKCLLSNSSSVSRLRSRARSGLLQVVNGTATDFFTGLSRVGSVTTTSGITGATAEGQVPDVALLVSGTTNKFWMGKRNVLAELDEKGRAGRKLLHKMIASDSSSRLAFPAGFKPVRVISAAGTYISLSTNAPKFDGFIWYMDSGLAASTNYDCELVEA